MPFSDWYPDKLTTDGIKRLLGAFPEVFAKEQLPGSSCAGQLFTFSFICHMPIPAAFDPVMGKGKKRVRRKGLEPSRSCDHRHLKPARLPIPPLLHFSRFTHAT